MQNEKRKATVRFWGTMIAMLLLTGCVRQRATHRVEDYINRHQLSPHVEASLRQHRVVPGMTMDGVHAAVGTPLPLQRTGPDYGFAWAKAYNVSRYDRLETVWVFFDQDSTVALVEW